MRRGWMLGQYEGRTEKCSSGSPSFTDAALLRKASPTGKVDWREGIGRISRPAPITVGPE
jgi:hypothetical protein